jgi:hypothetical protein
VANLWWCWRALEVLRSQDAWIEVETAVKVQLVCAKLLFEFGAATRAAAPLIRLERVLTWGVHHLNNYENRNT